MLLRQSGPTVARVTGRPFFSRRGFWASVGLAWRGLARTVMTEPNMRVHLVSAVLVGLVGSGIPLGLAEKVTLIFCVLFVFFAEILNSALEHLVDLATTEVDERARAAKDAAAAGVLVLSIGTVVIFVALLVHNWPTVMGHGEQILRQVLLGVPLAVLTGLLVREAWRPTWLDVAAFVAAVALIGLLAVRSESYVFTALTLGLVVLAGQVARMRRASFDREGK